VFHAGDDDGGDVFLNCHTAWGKLLVQYLLLRSAEAAFVNVESYQGNLKDGISFKNVQIKNWNVLGKDTIVHVQRLDVRLPVLEWQKIEANIFNARLDLPNSDPMLFSGLLKEGKIKGDVQAKSVDVSVLLKAFLKTDLHKMVHGTVSSVKFRVHGDIRNPSVQGGFVADKVMYSDKVVTQVFAKVDVTLAYEQSQWAMRGLVLLDGGEVDFGGNTYDLNLSKIIFTDNLIDPNVDIRCAIHKDIYDIDIHILGTIKYNKISASANPYLTQDKAFILLGMGKWAPLQSASMSLQNDAHFLGIKRKFGEGVNVGYGFEQSSENFRGELNSLQFIQGQMSLTDVLSVNVEKTIASSHYGDRYNRDDLRKDNESRLYLKFQNTF
jgi:hypothetical protein